MTCVIGLEHKGKVFMGGDSAGVDEMSLSVRYDEKVFVNGPLIIGFAGSFRMGQLLRYRLEAPDKPTNTSSDYEFMCTAFIDAVRECFKEGGFSTVTENVETGGEFLVGYRGTLYRVEEDFQVGRTVDGYDAIGCGQEFALGAMHATSLRIPHKRIEQALGVAANYSAGVCEPFTILSQ